ncbi:tetratricopeptide repeat protein [Neobacillus sp. Marseille-QA0830]
MIQFHDLQDFLHSYSNVSNYYVGERIPSKKEGNARSHYEISGDDTLYALFDGTLWGSAKEGLAITTSGIYWKNLFTKQPCTLLWKQFIALNIRKEGKEKIRLGENLELNIVSSLKTDGLLAFLKQLQMEVEAVLGDDLYLRNIDSTKDELASSLEVETYQESKQTEIENGLTKLHRDIAGEKKEEFNPELPAMFEINRKKLINSYDDNKKIYKGTNFHSYLEDRAKALKGNGVFTGSIPQKKIDNAKETYAYSVKADDIVALYDNTVFGSAKEGFILTYTGLYTGNKKSAGSIDFTRMDSITHQSGSTYSVITGSVKETVELLYADQKVLLDMVRNIIHYREMEYTIDVLGEEAKKRTGHINISKLIEKLDYCISIGKYNDSLEIAQELLNIGTNQEEICKAVARALCSIGEDYFSKGYFDLALDAFEASISYHHSNGQALVGLGLVYAERNNYSSALENFNAALALQSDHGTIFGYSGYCYFKMKNYNKALELFTNALKFNNDSYELYLFRAEIFMEKNRLHEAIEDLTAVLGTNKNAAKAWKMRGDCFYKLNSLENALEDFLAARKGGNTQEITEKISSIRVNLHHWKEAIDELTAVLHFGDNRPETYFNRAFAYKETEQYENAIADFTQALALDESMKNVYFLRGLCYENFEQYETAESDFKAAIQCNINKVEAEKHLAIVRDEIKKMQERREKEQKERKRNVFEAIDQSDVTRLRSLLQGINSDKDEMGLTVLMHAIIRGKTDVASALIPTSDIGAKDHNGYTAFEIAVIKNNMVIAQQLFEQMYEKSFISKGMAGLNKLGEAGLKKTKSTLTSALYKTSDPFQKDQIRIKLAEVEENLREVEKAKRRMMREEQEQKENKRKELISAAKERFRKDIINLLNTNNTSNDHEAAIKLKNQLAKEEEAYHTKLGELELVMAQLDEQYNKQIDEIKSLYYRSLAGEKGEFETTAQYEARVAEQNKKKEELDRFLLYPGLAEDRQLILEIRNAIEEAAKNYTLEKEEIISRNEQQKEELAKEYQLHKQHLEQEIEEEMRKSSIAFADRRTDIEMRLQLFIFYVSPILSTLSIGRYDADKQHFPIAMGENNRQVHVPIEKAPQFKENFDSHHVFIDGEFTIKNNQPLFSWNIIIQTAEGDKYTFDSGMSA